MEDINVEISQQENRNLRVKIWFIKIEKRFWYVGKELALALEYPNPKKAVQDHIDSRDKKSIDELLGKDYKKILSRILTSEGKNSLDEFFQKLERFSVLVSDLGLISFCTRSRKPRAVPFQRWVYKTMQKIKETGSYTQPVENFLYLISKIKTLEREIEASKKETKKTRDKATQTLKSVVVLDGSFRDLEERIVKALKKNKSSFKRAIKQVELSLEKSIQEVKLDTSSSSLSSNPHQLYYSSDSE